VFGEELSLSVITVAGCLVGSASARDEESTEEGEGAKRFIDEDQWQRGKIAAVVDWVSGDERGCK